MTPCWPSYPMTCRKPPSPVEAKAKPRQRGFSASLLRERIELTLSDEQKAGASKVFFTKVKEELQFIPAQLKVLEIWQEKAVFERDGEEVILAANRPVHPLGKCIATPSLLGYIITSKYADGLPLYRLEQMFKRLGQEVSRTSMAHWIIRLDEVFQPLMNLLREEQNHATYLQADETRIQVLKEEGKTAQSDKWMWVTRGGPPGRPLCYLNTIRRAPEAFLCVCWTALAAYCKPMVIPAIARCAKRAA